MDRLIENARRMGANAVVGADFETSDILQGTAPVFAAWGTAVIIKPAEKKRWVPSFSSFPIVVVYRVSICCERRPKAYILEYYDIMQIGGTGVKLFGNRRKRERKSAQGEAHRYRCDSCGKTFTKSLKMLDFEHEPPKEIEICPFCDKVLKK